MFLDLKYGQPCCYPSGYPSGLVLGVPSRATVQSTAPLTAELDLRTLWADSTLSHVSISTSSGRVDLNVRDDHFGLRLSLERLLEGWMLSVSVMNGGFLFRTHLPDYTGAHCSLRERSLQGPTLWEHLTEEA